jgi:cytochrome c
MTGAICYVMLSASSSAPQQRQEGDATSGQLIFNNARRTCHTTREGDNRLGPNLYKIVGRKAGSLQNYGYSIAMKGADFVWDESKLDRFIGDPEVRELLNRSVGCARSYYHSRGFRGLVSRTNCRTGTGSTYRVASSGGFGFL